MGLTGPLRGHNSAHTASFVLFAGGGPPASVLAGKGPGFKGSRRGTVTAPWAGQGCSPPDLLPRLLLDLLRTSLGGSMSPTVLWLWIWKALW